MLVNNAGRFRVLAGGVATVVVVALFALLLRGVAASRVTRPQGTEATPTPTATPQDTGRWQSYKQLSFTTGEQGEDAYPAIAPTDPATVYVATINPVGLARTTDEGGTWQQLALPGDASSVETLQVFVSPLDARTVFVAVTSPLPPGASPSACPTLAGGLLMDATGQSGTLTGGLPRSGTIPCTQVYYSHDGGAHWRLPSLPIPGVIVDAVPPGGVLLGLGHVLQSQGHRLFALLGCGALCSGPVSDLISSDDDGATWQLADGDMRAAGADVCDFAPAPSGGVVYAITTTAGCMQPNFPTEDLWRSTDGGAHWTRVGTLATPAAFGMAVVPRAGGGSLLYTHMPPATVQGHAVTLSDGPTSLHVSADGGATWQAAPATGIAPGWTPSVPMGVLGDGTVIECFTSSTPSGGLSSNRLYGWKLGDTAWQPIAPPLDVAIAALLVAPSRAGTTTLWATVLLNADNQATTVGVESYTP